MKAGSAAKLIVDALLQRFLPLARRRIETAQAQVESFLILFFSLLSTKKPQLNGNEIAKVLVVLLEF
jgi:hypothetical protein